MLEILIVLAQLLRRVFFSHRERSAAANSFRLSNTITRVFDPKPRFKTSRALRRASRSGFTSTSDSRLRQDIPSDMIGTISQIDDFEDVRLLVAPRCNHMRTDDQVAGPAGPYRKDEAPAEFS